MSSYDDFLGPRAVGADRPDQGAVMRLPTPAEWERAVATLIAVRNEVAVGYPPFDSDSYLPPHFVDALESVIGDFVPSPEAVRLAGRIKRDERLADERRERLPETLPADIDDAAKALREGIRDGYVARRRNDIAQELIDRRSESMRMCREEYVGERGAP